MSKQTVKTSVVNGETFTLAPTYAEMNDQVLMHLADQMLREMGGSRNMNSEISFILKHAESDYENAPFCYDDITHNEPTGNFETIDSSDDLNEEGKQALIEELEEKIEELQDLDDESWTEAGKRNEEEIEDLQRILEKAQDTECENYPEIMQWFSLDERLIYRLEKEGECTLVGEYWGRQAFGQSITMDHVMKKVCYDLALCWAK